MAYNYTNGDGVGVLLPAEPANSALIASSCAQAIRQIKAYLNDTTAGVASYKKTEVYTKAEVNALIAAIPSPGAFNSNPAVATGGGQTVAANGADVAVTGLTYVAPVTGWYSVSCQLIFDNAGADASDMQILIYPTDNGASGGQGGGTAVPNPPGNRWYPSFTALMLVTAGHTIGVNMQPLAGGVPGNVTMSNGELTVFRLST